MGLTQAGSIYVVSKKCAPPSQPGEGAHTPIFTDHNSGPRNTSRGRGWLIQSQERTKLFDSTAKAVQYRHRFVFAFVYQAEHTALR